MGFEYFHFIIYYASVVFVVFIASKYLVNCFLTTGNKKNKPTIFGKIIAKIIASENFHIDPILAAAPIITNNKNNNLYVKSATFPLPNKNFQDYNP